MPNRSVNLTPDLDDYVLTRVESGRYSNPSEMMQAALCALEREERNRERERKMEQNAGEEGDLRNVHEPDALRILWLNQFQPISDSRGIQADQSTI